MAYQSSKKGESLNPSLIRFCKFAAVGGSGIIVNTGVLYCMHDIAGLTLLTSSIISIESAILSNFTFNYLWTFQDKPGDILHKLFKFHLVSAIPIFANILILIFFADLGMYYLVANLIGILAGVSWNYLVNVRWTWK